MQSSVTGMQSSVTGIGVKVLKLWKRVRRPRQAVVVQVSIHPATRNRGELPRPVRDEQIDKRPGPDARPVSSLPLRGRRCMKLDPGPNLDSVFPSGALRYAPDTATLFMSVVCVWRGAANPAGI